MLTPEQMYHFLKENLDSHVVTLKGQRIHCLRVYGSKGHKTFNINYYIKNPGASVRTNDLNAKLNRFSNDKDLLQHIAQYGELKNSDKKNARSV